MILGNNISILVIGAHPDDIEIGCGGTLIKLRKHYDKSEIFYLCFTLGEKVDDKFQRYSELNKAMDYLGVINVSPVERLPDTELNNHKNDMIDILEAIEKQKSIDVIFTHNPYDIHHDHRAVSEVTIEAFRKMGAAILFYENITTPSDFKPNYLVGITETMNEKLELLEVFESQYKRDVRCISKESIKTLAKYRALQWNYGGYAEAFKLHKGLLS